MAKGTNRLTAGHLRKKGPAKLCDGGGLWLYITATDARRWVYRYRFEGRDYEMGLGSLLDVSMEEARELLAQYRKLRKQGKNPIRHPPSKTIEEEQSWTFDDCAEAYIDSHALGWSNPKHIDQWRSC